MNGSPSLLNNPTFNKVQQALSSNEEIFLVGGAIRDALLSRPINDFDFILNKDPRAISRKLANQLGGAYFLMDDERKTARIVLKDESNQSITLDFARCRGATIADDLGGRDFTINAMAVPVHSPGHLLDPLNGTGDLRAKRLRACSPGSMLEDPLRVMRGIRLAIAFDLRILPETLTLMKQAAPQLNNISYERRRNEFFRMLEGSHSATAIRLLDTIDALPSVLPELLLLKHVKQSPPHVMDVWNHTLATVLCLEDIINLLTPSGVPEKAANLAYGMLVMRLGRYRDAISAHLNSQLTPGRSIRSLIILAALYHDIAKPQTARQDENGRIRNLGHEEMGADSVVEMGKRLLLSNEEIAHLRTIVRNHMRIHLLAQTRQPPTRRAIYRFFRDTGPIGIEVCLLNLADTLATYGSPVDIDVWQAHLDICRALLECWYEKPAEAVHPPVLINGYDLQNELHLKPGPQLGRLLNALREAQAEGDVRDRQEAISFASHWISENKDK